MTSVTSVAPVGRGAENYALTTACRGLGSLEVGLESVTAAAAGTAMTGAPFVCPIVACHRAGRVRRNTDRAAAYYVARMRDVAEVFAGFLRDAEGVSNRYLSRHWKEIAPELADHWWVAIAAAGAAIDAAEVDRDLAAVQVRDRRQALLGERRWLEGFSPASRL